MILYLEEETRVLEEKLGGEVGVINPTDMLDASGQELRVATRVPRPSSLTTWQTWQSV